MTMLHSTLVCHLDVVVELILQGPERFVTWKRGVNRPYGKNNHTTHHQC